MNIVCRGMQQYHNFKQMWKNSDRRTKVAEVREMLKIISQDNGILIG